MTIEPIAIVGQSCLLPGVHSPADLWNAVINGRDLLSQTPEDAWRVDRSTVMTDDRRNNDRAYSDRGGYVRGFEAVFDPTGFSIPADEVRALDPVAQWLLHTGREALRDAGLAGRSLPRAGAVIGNLSYPSRSLSALTEAVWLDAQGEEFFAGRGRELAGIPRPSSINRFMSGLPAHMLARALQLGAGAYCLDAACASSLYAIELACAELREGRADLMLAGGINAADDLFIHVGFCALQAMSPSGKSRPFHRDADGLVPAEGAALVALKRLGDAIRDGDEVAGIIRAVGLANDGRGRGLLVPCKEGQSRALRSAYAKAGLQPSDVSLIEAHATGTPLGDLVEIETLSDVFAGVRNLPIGSLKANLGHLITASGVAALLKVLAAMRAGIRAGTLYADEPVTALVDNPWLRLLLKSEPWDVDGPRRAGISNFGFGGNDAHLIVEEYGGPQRAAVYVRAPGRPSAVEPERIAIVGMEVIAGDGTGLADFANDLLGGGVRVRTTDGVAQAKAQAVELPLLGLRFPPSDLAQALPQQLFILKAVANVLGRVGDLPRERTGVLVGMQCDTETAGYGARLRMQHYANRWASAAGLDAPPDGWVDEARDRVTFERGAAGVIGAMPNIPANRLNSQFDLAGPSFTVSAEELSGVVALELAARSLISGEMDAMVVGAVDMSCELVHRIAVQENLPHSRHIPGDAAVVLVLERASDARRKGRTIYATLDPPALGAGDPERADDEARLGFADGHLNLTPQFGHAHAASGLLHVAAAALACHHSATPRGKGLRANPWLPDFDALPNRPHARVAIEALGGQMRTVQLYAEERPANVIVGPNVEPHVYRGRDAAEVLARIDAGDEGGAGEACLVIVCTGRELVARRTTARRLLEGAGDVPILQRNEGIYYYPRRVEGEVAFVFTGPAGAYHGMGREMILAFSSLYQEDYVPCVKDAAAWVFESASHEAPPPAAKLWGGSVLAHLHAVFSQKILGIRPQAAIGFCSGESSSLFALGAWRDMTSMYDRIRDDGVFTREIGGELRMLQRAWGGRDGVPDPIRWVNWRVFAEEADVEGLVQSEPFVRLTIVNAPGDVVIGGDPAGVDRVVEKVGRSRCYPIGYDVALHCEEAKAYEGPWHDLHRRETFEVPGVRFYSAANCSHYQLSADACADAITAMSQNRVNFPAMIRNAYADGVRIFIEHGPRDGCSKWITRTLGDLEHVSVAWDRGGVSSLEQIQHALGQLLAGGLDVDTSLVSAHLAASGHPAPPRLEGPTRLYSAHAEPLRMPPMERAPAKSGPAASPERSPARRPAPAPLPVASAKSDNGHVRVMAPAPSLPRTLVDSPVRSGARAAAPAGAVAAARSPISVAAVASAAPAFDVSVAAVASAAPAFDVSVAAVASAAPAFEMSVEAGAAAWTAHATVDPSHGDAVALYLATSQAQMASAHRAFIEAQAHVHAELTNVRHTSLQHVLQAGTSAPAAVWHPPTPAVRSNGAASTHSVVTPKPAPSAPEASSKPAPSAPEASSKPAPSAPKASSKPAPSAPEASKPPSNRTELFAAQSDAYQPVGRTFSREELAIHASGKISEIFGPLFARQDAWIRQVRMPARRLLLADRVSGIDAEPGSMKKGTVWTETDVGWDRWYVNYDATMPSGLVVEAGQADLFLISYLGADFENEGKRVYRLLGCELEYMGGLARPGDVLTYEIKVVGHARVGKTRLFFFQYDGRVNGELRLKVRNGQAGFFSYEEMADSGGVLWDAAEAGPPTADGEARVDPPAVPDPPRQLPREVVEMISRGEIWQALGKGFEYAASHTRTPRIQSGAMLLLQKVAECDPTGGPWGRGYIRIENELRPDAWYLDGHFENDPCMPGTLMVEGCAQAMALYMIVLGYTVQRDGWIFQPVPGHGYEVKCRGQVTTTNRTLTYEIFIDEIVDGPIPTIFADILGTSDGLKIFHGRRVGLQLVPEWPLSSMPRILEGYEEPNPKGIAQLKGFPFDFASLMACAYGRPTAAFGPEVEMFCGTRHIARLPGPPYHFMSRVTRLDAEPTGTRARGAYVEVEYDVPPDAWYFDANGARTMPFCALLEVALQPCGWLSVFVGTPAVFDIDLYFRNLDGTGTVHAEVRPDTGTLVTKSRMRSVSTMKNVVLMSFDVEVWAGDTLIYSLDTGFGFFPGDAFAAQPGLAVSDHDRAWLTEANDVHVDLRARPERYCGGTLRLPDPMLLMIDEIDGLWPTGGKEGLGKVRARKKVNPAEWFFKAHFFQDPVQPGSLGCEAMIQLLQWWMIHTEQHAGIDSPRFEILALGDATTWKYRGQIVPRNQMITLELDVLGVGTDEKGRFARALAHVWVDGLRIYAYTFAVRIVSGGHDDQRRDAHPGPGFFPAPREGYDAAFKDWETTPHPVASRRGS